MNFNPRTLRANEVKARVQSAKANGAILLLYTDSRTCMDILDEAVGSLNWKREHTRDNKNCIISIWDDSKNQWISKEDVGMESNADAEKGLASDAFKRAAVNFGISRELYSAPFMWISKDKCNIQESNGHCNCFDKFEVEAIEYDDARNISYLRIKNGNTKKVAFEWGTSKAGRATSGDKASGSNNQVSRQNSADIISEDEGRALIDLGKEIFKENWSKNLTDIAKKYGYSGTKNMKRADYDKIMAEIRGMAA